MPQNKVLALLFGFSGMPSFEHQRALGAILRRLNPNIPWVALLEYGPEDSGIQLELDKAKHFFPHSRIDTLVFTGSNAVFFEALGSLRIPETEAGMVLFIDRNDDTLALARAIGFEVAHFDYHKDLPSALQKILEAHVLLES